MIPPSPTLHMANLIVLPGPAPESHSFAVTTSPNAMPVAAPEPFAMNYPDLGAGAKSLSTAFRALREAEATEFFRHVKECADCVFAAVRADMERGALPLPLHDPQRVEEDLYARATLQAQNSWYGRAFGESCFTTLLLADTIPSYQSNLSLSEMDFAEALFLSLKGAGHYSAARSAVLLHGGTQHQCAEVGLGVRVDWHKAAVVVLRNLILTALWDDAMSRSELKLNLTKWERDRRSPVWVGETPTVVRDSPPTGRRRKRA